ncbi:MAG: DMT family transporter [Omnitrophica WOR_2 bacterium]
MNSRTARQSLGINAALASALFLGLTPVFGTLAIRWGMPPLEVVAFRTALAAFMVFILILIYNRKFLFIYPAGLFGCLLAGGINGFGSLLYYAALGRIDASLGQIIYSLYPLLVALWLWLDSQPPSRLTIIRLLLVLPALYFLVGRQAIDLIGVLMMVGAAALYALHLPINERVLYDMPAPTVTLYTLLAMTVIVVPGWLLSSIGIGFFHPSGEAWGAALGLTLVTFLSRLTLFMGVKHLGGLQTAILGLGELLITVFFSHVILGEQLSTLQWLGACLLIVSLALVWLEKPVTTAKSRKPGGWLSWLRPPGLPSDIPW